MIAALAFVVLPTLVLQTLAPETLHQVLILDTAATAVPTSLARALDPIVLQAANAPGILPLTQRDIKTLADVDAAAASIGCDSTSCMTAIADAMGAELVLAPQLSRLGNVTTVTLTLYQRSNSKLARESVTVTTDEQLHERVPPAVQRLLAPYALVVAEPQPEADGLSALTVVGMTVLGAGMIVSAGGGVIVGVSETTIQQASAASGDKRDAQNVGLAALAGVALGVVLMAVGAGLWVVSAA